MKNEKIMNYLIWMLIFQVIFIVTPHVPIGVGASERLHFVAITSCALLGATIVTIYRFRKNSKSDSSDVKPQ